MVNVRGLFTGLAQRIEPPVSTGVVEGSSPSAGMYCPICGRPYCCNDWASVNYDPSGVDSDTHELMAASKKSHSLSQEQLSKGGVVIMPPCEQALLLGDVHRTATSQCNSGLGSFNYNPDADEESTIEVLFRRRWED